MSQIRVAQLQLPVTPEKAKNIENVKRYLDEVCREGVDLAALPEMFCCSYQNNSFSSNAEREGGKVWTACSELARQYGIYLSAGTIPELDDKGLVYNTAYVFSPAGKQIAKHRKMHLFDINIKGGQQFKESETLSAGNTVTVFDTEFGTMGLCVCYDFRFPELARLMALRGAKVILVPAAFNMTTGPAHWELMFRSRAVDQQVYALGTAPARNHAASYVSWGHSIAVDPWGRVMAQMDEKEGHQISMLNLEQVDQVREQLPLLKHRRTDIYTLQEVEH
jgi:omega-amidase